MKKQEFIPSKKAGEGGMFSQLLKRNNSKLREDRGNVIVRNAEKAYRRKIEDLEDTLEQQKIDSANMMDINPGNTQTIINPSDFDVTSFVTKDIELGIEMRKTEIALEVAIGRYTSLFGESIQESKSNK